MQPERTRLAWQRTALSIAVGALVYARVEATALGVASWVTAVLGAAAGIAVGYWSRRRYRHTHTTLTTGRSALADGKLLLMVAVVVTGAAALALGLALLRRL